MNMDTPNESVYKLRECKSESNYSLLLNWVFSECIQISIYFITPFTSAQQILSHHSLCSVLFLVCFFQVHHTKNAFQSSNSHVSQSTETGENSKEKPTRRRFRSKKKNYAFHAI